MLIQDFEILKTVLTVPKNVNKLIVVATAILVERKKRTIAFY